MLNATQSTSPIQTSPLPHSGPRPVLLAPSQTIGGAPVAALYEVQHASSALGTVSMHLNSLRADINETMNGRQSYVARTLTVVGTLASLGGAGAAAFFGITALAGTATGLGIPVAALAALAGVAVFVTGASVAMLVAGILRSIMRRNLKDKPNLQERLMSASLIREALLAKPTLTNEEKVLVKQLNYVLAKTEGFGAAMKAQVKTAAKTVGWTAASVILVPFVLLSGGGGIGLDGGLFSSPFNLGSSKSSGFFSKKIDPKAQINLGVSESVYNGLKKARV